MSAARLRRPSRDRLGPASAAADPADEALWRALADPTRRALLDLLRDGPLPTGRLAERFDMSRFGVLKHLGVLRDAGLVHVEERGRERWNHLDPVPIRRLEARWLRPFTRRAADSLLALAAAAESRDGGTDARTTMNDSPTTAVPEPARVFTVLCELRIDAAPEQVWDALTGDVSGWWHPAYRVRSDAAGVRLEPTAGGRLFEDWGAGEGLVWGHVVVAKRPEWLSVCGDTAGRWGGPSRSFMTWELEADGDGTIVRFTQEGFGRATEETLTNLDGGWKYLFEECLKRFVETGSIEGAPELT